MANEEVGTPTEFWKGLYRCTICGHEHRVEPATEFELIDMGVKMTCGATKPCKIGDNYAFAQQVQG